MSVAAIERQALRSASTLLPAALLAGLSAWLLLCVLPKVNGRFIVEEGAVACVVVYWSPNIGSSSRAVASHPLHLPRRCLSALPARTCLASSRFIPRCAALALRRLRACDRAALLRRRAAARGRVRGSDRGGARRDV